MAVAGGGGFVDVAGGGWFVDVASGGWSVDLLSTWGASSTRRAVMRAVMVVGVDGAGGGWWRLVVTWRGLMPAAARSSTWQALTGRAAAVDRVVDGLALVGRLSTGWGVVVVVGRRDGCVTLLGHSQQFCQP